MIPERNGISRLDEMMSGVVRVDMIIKWLIYCIRYNSYVLQIVDVAPLSFRVELTARCWCAVFYSSADVQGDPRQVGVSGCLLWAPRGVGRILRVTI